MPTLLPWRTNQQRVATDSIGMDCTSAGVSLREPLSPDGLVRAPRASDSGKKRGTLGARGTQSRRG